MWHPRRSEPVPGGSGVGLGVVFVLGVCQVRDAQQPSRGDVVGASDAQQSAGELGLS